MKNPEKNTTATMKTTPATTPTQLAHTAAAFGLSRRWTTTAF